MRKRMMSVPEREVVSIAEVEPNHMNHPLEALDESTVSVCEDLIIFNANISVSSAWGELGGILAGRVGVMEFAFKAIHLCSIVRQPLGLVDGELDMVAFDVYPHLLDSISLRLSRTRSSGEILNV